MMRIVMAVALSMALGSAAFAKKRYELAPELVDAFKYFLGDWTCEGTRRGGQWGPGGKETHTLKFKMDKMWLVAHGAMELHNKPPMKLTITRVISYYYPSKKWSRTDSDSLNNTILLYSPGWEGDKLNSTGTLSSRGTVAAPLPNLPNIEIRHTLTKKSDTEMSDVFEWMDPDGKWAPMSEDTCKKK